MPEWDSAQYLKFTDERTQPCRDLAARIPLAAPANVIDLGCGPGNSTEVLAARWPAAHLTGLDSSPAMIAAAGAAHPGWTWTAADIAEWSGTATETYDVVFSNAALQWLPDHAALYPGLLRRVTVGGVLAVQVPGNWDGPAHRIMREVAARHPTQNVREWYTHDAPFYYDALAPHAARLDIWYTDYVHILPDAEAIVEWYKGTGMRPFLEALPTDAVRAAFTADYLEAIRVVFTRQPDGRVLFPFRRLFLIAWR